MNLLRNWKMIAGERDYISEVGIKKFVLKFQTSWYAPSRVPPLLDSIRLDYMPKTRNCKEYRRNGSACEIFMIVLHDGCATKNCFVAKVISAKKCDAMVFITQKLRNIQECEPLRKWDSSWCVQSCCVFFSVLLLRFELHALKAEKNADL